MASTTDEISMVAIDISIEKLENSSLTIAKNMQKAMDDKQGKLGLFGRESLKSTDHKYMFSRVLDSVRKEGEHDYEPQIISIGPIHRDKEALKPMELLKWKYLSELIRRNSKKNTLENYVKAIRTVEEKARKLYSESVELGDDNFVKMMVLDGCFLIEFLVKNYYGENQQRYLNELNLSRGSLPLLRRDLLLLENQIPYLILDVLFKSSDIPKLEPSTESDSPIQLCFPHVLFKSSDIPNLEPSTESDSRILNRFKFFAQTPTLEKLIIFFSVTVLDTFNPLGMFRYLDWHLSRDLAILKDVVHLLHVHHACFRSPRNYHESRYTIRKNIRRIGRLVAVPFLLLLYCLLTCKTGTNFWGCRHRAYRRGRGLRALVGEIPSATQLHNSGVNFKKKNNLASVVATFDKEEGILEIPTFSLEDAEISTFRNLIAFEQAYPTAGNRITGHALLMACLVRTKEDVAILRDSGIIESMLKKDKRVVEVFDQLLKGSYLDFERLDNRELFEEVLEYCSAFHHKWRADLKRKYFGNPWTVASLIAAIVILLLTFAQTFYTIYAYHHPRST